MDKHNSKDQGPGDVFYSSDLPKREQPDSGNATRGPLLKVHPGLAAQSLKNKIATEYGLWLLARSIDHAGTGVVHKGLLVSYAQDIGWKDAKIRRVIHNAISLGLITPIPDDKFILSGILNVCKIIGVEHLFGSPVMIPADHLYKPAVWKSCLLSAVHSARKELPTSTRYIEEKTGVPARTQYRYVRQSGVHVVHNFCETEIDASHISGFRDNGIPAFRGKNNKIAWQLPSSYSVPYTRGNRGNTRRVNRQLKEVLVKSAAGQHPCRTYHRDSKSLMADYKANMRGKKDLPAIVYLHKLDTTNRSGRVVYATWKVA